MSMNTIDARGLSCPEPVIMTRKALKSGENHYAVLVDNVASRENVTRFAESQGYRVKLTEENGQYRLELSK
jgi:TusA-related sulfurtransferase